MADSAINSNIFGENFSSFVNTLKQFKSFDKLIAPVREHCCCGKKVYTIASRTVNSEEIFPVFTDINAIEPPLLRKTSQDFLRMIFCNPAIQTILINPLIEQAKPGAITGNAMKLDRNKLSIMIGSLESDAKSEDIDDFVKKILNELNQGKLHKANYISSLAIAQGKARQIAAIYPQLLINLRLYQDAYDFIKIFPKNPAILYYSAVIFRATGNFKKTLEILNSIAEDVAMENKKKLQKAWIEMSLGNFKEAEGKFKELLNSPLEKSEASIGLGMTLSKKGLLEKDLQALNGSLHILKESLEIPCGLNAQAHFYIGNIYFNTAKYQESIEHYLKSFELTPTLPAMINTANAYLKLEKYEETLNTALLIALVDLNSAEKILSEFPKNILARLNTVHPDISTIQNISQYTNIFNISKPEEKELPKKNLQSKSSETISTENFTYEILKPMYPETPPKTKNLKPPFDATETEQKQPFDNTETTSPIGSSNPEEKQKKELPQEDNPINIISLEPNKPIAQSDRIKTDEENSSKKPENELKMESSSRIFSANIQNAHKTDSENDEFMTRAFKLASQLENDFDKKIRFNIDGITEIEKKLRIAFIGERLNHQQKLELILDCSAFLCYAIKEKYRGKLIKFSDFDPWAWPMLFENSEIITYPIERLWRLIWLKKVPDTGWLIRYAQYLDGLFKTTDSALDSGISAVKNKIRSHPEKIIDAQTEHKKIMILNSSLEETSLIKLDRAGISEIENSIKVRFKPQVPPSSEGWKLLRCYAHIFVEILIKELQVRWFNTEGNDGQWSMYSPWMTFIFPLGKVYKCAANGESLMEYFEHLLEEKKQHI
ncbi:MAG: tetratricopeptide repeat protein [Elusimicrobia bacterium]|nr:tetratricopeptide repeat protein [Elusimicrobiota bacterium]